MGNFLSRQLIAKLILSCIYLFFLGWKIKYIHKVPDWQFSMKGYTLTAWRLLLIHCPAAAQLTFQKQGHRRQLDPVINDKGEPESV